MKRFVSLLLCAVLLFGMIPTVSAQAETDSATVQTAENNVSVKGTNSVGNLLSEEIQQAQAESQEEASGFNGGYAVIDLSFDGNIATVEYSSLEEANLIVALYSEDGMQLLTSGNAVVSPDETVAEVTVEGEMPQYFMASAYLVDIYDFSPLCPAYDTPMYTKAMRDLLASTIEDYDQEKILNLDDSTETNFAVYTDSVVVIDGGNGVNTVAAADYENDIYVIENADEQITSLTVGTIIAYPYAAGEVLIVKIAAITINGTTATITGAEMEIEEVFSYLKLETNGGMDNAEVDESYCEEGVTYEGVIEETAPATRNAWEGGAEAKRGLSFKLEKKLGGSSGVTVSGGVSLSIKASISFYISLSRQSVEVKITPQIAAEVSITGKLTGVDIALAKVKIPTAVPGITFELSQKIVLEAQASIKFKASISATFGFGYDSKDGFQDLCSKPKAEADISIEGKVFFGLKLTATTAILDENIASVGFSTKSGIQVTGELRGTNHDGNLTEKDLEIHSCTSCLDMSFDYIQELSAEAKFLKFIKLEKNFGSVMYHLFKFYYSMDSVNGGSGFGSCPNLAYRITLNVTDKYGKAIENATISDSSDNSWGTTNSNGVMIKYLPIGTYVVNAVLDGQTGKKSFGVSEAACVTVLLDETEFTPNVSLTNILGTLNVNEYYSESVITSTVTYTFSNYPAGVQFAENEVHVLDDVVTVTTNECKFATQLRLYQDEKYDGNAVFSCTKAIQSLVINAGHKDATLQVYASDDGETWVLIEEVVVDGFDNSMYAPYADYNVEMPKGTSYKYLKLDAVGAQIRIPYFIFTFYEDNNATISTKGTERNLFPVRGVFGGGYDTEKTDACVLQTASFSNLVPEKEYLLLAMISMESERPLAASNLLFVDQAVSQEDGTLAFCYVQRESMAISYVMVCGATNKDLNDAVVSLPLMCADEDVQAVNPTVDYDGETLREGLDYTVVGTVDFTESGTYTCYIRGIYNYTGLVPCTYTVLDKSAVTAWNLTLGEMIAMNFYMEIGDDIKDDAIVDITLAGETVSLSAADGVLDETTGQYVFTVKLATAQMTETVTVALRTGEEMIGQKSYSVRQYADYILDEVNGYDDSIKTLVREMLNYGAMSQIHFDYNTESLANENITDTAMNDVPYSTERITGSDNLDSLEFYGASLVCRERIAVRYYFQANGDLSGLTFTADKNSYIPVQKDDLYYVEIADILPQNLDKQIKLTVEDSQGNALTVSYSPINYIVRMHEKGSDTLRDLVKAMYNYHLAVKAFCTV